ncbi:hypothetical protein C8Q74DRAFT_968131 [Fomes fomentarius]|nr:hypothetical protein C8Q74DRAFT_968131 [Fomes fomentarius]
MRTSSGLGHNANQGDDLPHTFRLPRVQSVLVQVGARPREMQNSCNSPYGYLRSSTSPRLLALRRSRLYSKLPDRPEDQDHNCSWSLSQICDVRNAQSWQWYEPWGRRLRPRRVCLLPRPSPLARSGCLRTAQATVPGKKGNRPISSSHAQTPHASQASIWSPGPGESPQKPSLIPPSILESYIHSIKLSDVGEHEPGEGGEKGQPARLRWRSKKPPSFSGKNPTGFVCSAPPQPTRTADSRARGWTRSSRWPRRTSSRCWRTRARYMHAARTASPSSRLCSGVNVSTSA